MTNEIQIGCHDCGEETIILNKYNETEQEDICFCPKCGSDNIDIL